MLIEKLDEFNTWILLYIVEVKTPYDDLKHFVQSEHYCAMFLMDVCTVNSFI